VLGGDGLRPLEALELCKHYGHLVVVDGVDLVESGLGIAALVPETATLERLFSQLTENAQTDVPAAACAPDRQP
jgi:hypothetical protein